MSSILASPAERPRASTSTSSATPPSTSTSTSGATARTTARAVITGLDFPTSLAFDAQGRPHVAESGLRFDASKSPEKRHPNGRILRLTERQDGSNGELAAACLVDGLRGPVNGLLALADGFVVSEGGNPGRLSRVSLDGERTTLIDDLPGLGNYHTNMAVLGTDGRLYFSQGAMTNSGIIGLDSYEIGWLGRLPHDADIPGYNISLNGVEASTPNPLDPTGPPVSTGAFASFGSSHPKGQTLRGRTPATAAVLRCQPDGSELEVVAWGLRNAYGLCFLPDGRLLATDQGPDDRGSRPIGNAPDLLFVVCENCWYGWPDYVGGVPVSDPRFTPTRGPAPTPILAHHERLPPPERPLLEFPVNAAATKMAIIPEEATRWPGQILVALFGDEKPMTAPPGGRVGRSLARIDPTDWSLHPVRLPAAIAAEVERPIDVQVDARGETVWLVDFGGFEMTRTGVEATPSSGALWRMALSELD